MPQGKHTPPQPAGPGADHARNFNRAIDDALNRWQDRPGDYTVELQVTINPGSIKDYRVVLR